MSFITRLFNNKDPNAPAEGNVSPDEPEMELTADEPPSREPESGDLVIELMAPPSAAKPAAPAKPAVYKPTLPGVAPPKTAAIPPASKAKANGAVVKGAGSLSDTGQLLAQVEASIDGTANGKAAVADGVSTAEDLAAVRKLFDEVARGYLV